MRASVQLRWMEQMVRRTAGRRRADRGGRRRGPSPASRGRSRWPRRCGQRQFASRRRGDEHREMGVLDDRLDPDADALAGNGVDGFELGEGAEIVASSRLGEVDDPRARAACRPWRVEGQVPSLSPEARMNRSMPPASRSRVSYPAGSAGSGSQRLLAGMPWPAGAAALSGSTMTSRAKRSTTSAFQDRCDVAVASSTR
jgi:hypothetical protein